MCRKMKKSETPVHEINATICSFSQKSFRIITVKIGEEAALLEKNFEMDVPDR
jgi:hypothetical protein